MKSYAMPLLPQSRNTFTPHGCGFPFTCCFTFSVPLNGTICSSMQSLGFVSLLWLLAGIPWNILHSQQQAAAANSRTVVARGICSFFVSCISILWSRRVFHSAMWPPWVSLCIKSGYLCCLLLRQILIISHQLHCLRSINRCHKVTGILTTSFRPLALAAILSPHGQLISLQNCHLLQHVLGYEQFKQWLKILFLRVLRSRHILLFV